jgi:hypothetical protein
MNTTFKLLTTSHFYLTVNYIFQASVKFKKDMKAINKIYFLFLSILITR